VTRAHSRAARWRSRSRKGIDHELVPLISTRARRRTTSDPADILRQQQRAGLEPERGPAAVGSDDRGTLSFTSACSNRAARAHRCASEEPRSPPPETPHHHRTQLPVHRRMMSQPRESRARCSTRTCRNTVVLVQ